MDPKTVVILIDHKQRDLMSYALLGFHLQQKGFKIFFEPVEAYRGCLAAHKPDLIIFNHLIASHLAQYSQKLNRMGVRTAVIINEGLCYDDEVRDYNAGKHHKDAHIDLMFCWNKPFEEAVLSQRGDDISRVVTVGPPRHDFYFKPWSTLFKGGNDSRKKPNILFCTNFGLAKYFHYDKSEIDKVFASWSKSIPVCKDYWEVVKNHHDSQIRIREFINAVASDDHYNITIRPHPREDPKQYVKWIDSLNYGESVSVDSSSNITELILDCDLLIGCQNCNTILEGWVAGKPTIALEFNKHPLLNSPEVKAKSPTCKDPSQLPNLIQRELNDPAQDDYTPKRQKHISKWLASPKGATNAKIADEIGAFFNGVKKPNWSHLSLTDKRRGAKLRLLSCLGKPYNYNPIHPFLNWLLGGRHKLKIDILDKTVFPGEGEREISRIQTMVNGLAN